MEFFSYKAMLVVTMALTFRHLPLVVVRSSTIGVNYGFNGDNLPAPVDVINLYTKCKINLVRIFEPKIEVLKGLKGRPNLLVMGTKNEDIKSLASSQVAANAWINTYVAPYAHSVNIGFITVGNEVVPAPEADYVAPAIKNLVQALRNAKIAKDIKVTTVVSMSALAVSYPPSAGKFKDVAAGPMKAIVEALKPHAAPIMLTAYPYFAYASNPQQISPDYALFRSKTAVVKDMGYEYYNLFDAMVDAFYAALEAIGGSSVRVDIAETGWPSAGNEPYTSVDNARTYNMNFLKHALSGKGTPRRPNMTYNSFVFEMFNEDQKVAGVEQHFGFFYPNMEPVYPVWPHCS